MKSKIRSSILNLLETKGQLISADIVVAVSTKLNVTANYVKEELATMFDEGIIVRRIPKGRQAYHYKISEKTNET